MYEAFYGLSRTPFAVTPDPAMLFMSRVHREALATIIYGVETRKGFMVCTGEVGTGKSTIIRAFFDQARADVVKLIYIFTPQVSPLEMAQYICRELDMEDPDSIFQAVPRLQLKLLELFESGRTVVLMIDEAQLLPPETLEFLRLLSNFETDTEKLIQIVLVGQPEVDTMLARRDMRQVNQRVALRARLAPLSLDESFDYIDHRLRVSGAGELAQVMSPSAAWLIGEAAGGIPRVINILADNVLIAGFGAAQRPVGSRIAGSTVREFIANSGPAQPIASERFGVGRRAARRLRSALVREKSEPADWLAAPAPIRHNGPAPLHPTSMPEHAPPPAAMQPIAQPPAVPHATEPERIEPTARPARAPENAKSPALPERAQRMPPPASVPPAPILVSFAEPPLDPPKPPEPTGDEWRVARIAPGSPVSTVGIAIVAPVAQPVADVPETVAAMLEKPAGARPRPAPRPAVSAVARIMNGAGSRKQSSPVPPPARAAPAMQWPALNRVRNDLRTAPRRSPGTA